VSSLLNVSLRLEGWTLCYIVTFPKTTESTCSPVEAVDRVRSVSYLEEVARAMTKACRRPLM